MARPSRPRRSRGTLIPFILLLAIGGTACAWYAGVIPEKWQTAARSLLAFGKSSAPKAGDDSIPPPEETGPEQLKKIQAELAQMEQSEPAPEASEPSDEVAKLPRGIEPTEAPPLPGEPVESDLGVGQNPNDVIREAKARTGVKPAVFEDETLPSATPPAPKRSGKSKRKAQRPPTDEVDRTGASSVRHVPGTASVDAGETALQGDMALIDLNTIQGLFDKGDIAAGHRELSRWFWKEPARREEFRKQLDESARQLYFAQQPYYEEPYVIQSGDQLQTIARKHKLTWDYLAKLNRVEPRRIREGQKLKVVPGPFSALVSLGRHEIIVHQNGNYVKSYRVGLGKDSSTPLGTFHVKNKEKNPTYYGPPGIGVIKADDPQNPLGERWIDIGDSYGIHGTIDPESIGKNELRGCVRLLNSEVEEVYDFLIIGSEVRIVR